MQQQASAVRYHLVLDDRCFSEYGPSRLPQNYSLKWLLILFTEAGHRISKLSDQSACEQKWRFREAEIFTRLREYSLAENPFEKKSGLGSSLQLEERERALTIESYKSVLRSHYWESKTILVSPVASTTREMGVSHVFLQESGISHFFLSDDLTWMAKAALIAFSLDQILFFLIRHRRTVRTLFAQEELLADLLDVLLTESGAFPLNAHTQRLLMQVILLSKEESRTRILGLFSEEKMLIKIRVLPPKEELLIAVRKLSPKEEPLLKMRMLLSNKNCFDEALLERVRVEILDHRIEAVRNLLISPSLINHARLKTWYEKFLVDSGFMQLWTRFEGSNHMAQFVTYVENSTLSQSKKKDLLTALLWAYATVELQKPKPVSVLALLSQAIETWAANPMDQEALASLFSFGLVKKALQAMGLPPLVFEHPVFSLGDHEGMKNPRQILHNLECFRPLLKVVALGDRLPLREPPPENIPEVEATEETRLLPARSSEQAVTITLETPALPTEKPDPHWPLIRKFLTQHPQFEWACQKLSSIRVFSKEEAIDRLRLVGQKVPVHVQYWKEQPMGHFDVEVISLLDGESVHFYTQHPELKKAVPGLLPPKSLFSLTADANGWLLSVHAKNLVVLDRAPDQRSTHAVWPLNSCSLSEAYACLISTLEKNFSTLKTQPLDDEHRQDDERSQMVRLLSQDVEAQGNFEKNKALLSRVMLLLAGVSILLVSVFPEKPSHSEESALYRRVQARMTLSGRELLTASIMVAAYTSVMFSLELHRFWRQRKVSQNWPRELRAQMQQTSFLESGDPFVRRLLVAKTLVAMYPDHDGLGKLVEILDTRRFSQLQLSQALGSTGDNEKQVILWAQNELENNFGNVGVTTNSTSVQNVQHRERASSKFSWFQGLLRLLALGIFGYTLYVVWQGFANQTHTEGSTPLLDRAARAEKESDSWSFWITTALVVLSLASKKGPAFVLLERWIAKQNRNDQPPGRNAPELLPETSMV